MRCSPKPFEHCTWVEKTGMFPREVTKNILNPEDHNGSQIWVMHAMAETEDWEFRPILITRPVRFKPVLQKTLFQNK